jgi:DNA-binding Lrp family transcriptional regulator
MGRAKAAEKQVAELEYFNAELRCTIDERDLWITTDAKRIAELEEVLSQADNQLWNTNANWRERCILAMDIIKSALNK